MRNIIDRTDYTEHIRRMFGRGFIVALTGQRRVGKSCVMRSIKDRLERDEKNNIIFIDKEKTAFDQIKDYVTLEKYVAEHIAEGKKNYLFVDEVQEIAEFEKALLSMLSDDVCQIMVIRHR